MQDEIPDPRYVRAEDGTLLAYQVYGDGPVDVLWLPELGTTMDADWESRWLSSAFRGLGSSVRLVLHDRRGTGLSTRHEKAPNLETRASDLETILNAVGSKSVAAFGLFEGLAPAVLLAAIKPERVGWLIWWNPVPRTTWAPDYSWGMTAAEIELELAGVDGWGTIAGARAFAVEYEKDTGIVLDEDEIRLAAKAARNSCTPDFAREMMTVWYETDLRSILGTVQSPTLLLPSGRERNVQVARYVAELMPRAELVSLPGSVGPGRGAAEDYIGRIQREVARFLGVPTPPAAADSVLASVLFTDIVGSTEVQAIFGDRGWSAAWRQHSEIVRDALARWHGRECDTAGDGFFAVFEGPARAVRCALDISEATKPFGLEIRAGVHTGECELIDGHPAGITVTTGARISALAGASQVLVSETVKDLVAGSGLTLRDIGEFGLKGVPKPHRLYAVGR